MVDLHAQYLRIKNEIDEAIDKVLTSTAFIQGPEVEEFAKALGEPTPVQSLLSHARTVQMLCKLP